MANRVNRFIAKVWGDPANPVTVVFNYNSVPAYSGTVPTDSGTVDQRYNFNLNTDIAFTWETDESLEGVIPVSLTVTGGTLLFSTITANMLAGTTAITLKQDPALWPMYKPNTVDEFQTDVRDLSLADFTAKYGFSNAGGPNNDIQPRVEVTELVAKEFNWIIPYKIFDSTTDPASDGKNNVKVDGVDQPREWSQSDAGQWSYIVPSGATLTFNHSIDLK